MSSYGPKNIFFNEKLRKFSKNNHIYVQSKRYSSESFELMNIVRRWKVQEHWKHLKKHFPGVLERYIFVLAISTRKRKYFLSGHFSWFNLHNLYFTYKDILRVNDDLGVNSYIHVKCFDYCYRKFFSEYLNRIPINYSIFLFRW